jgi:uncharacterized membrane protein YkvI
LLRLGTILSLAAVEVGALVGAGFASGREVHEYFGVHAGAGAAGVGLFAVLLAILGGWFLDAARRVGSRSYRELSVAMAGEMLAAVADPVVALGLFVGLAVTLAGAGALLAQMGWGHEALGVGACAAVTLALAWRGEGGLVAANAIVVPLLVLLVVAVAGPSALGAAPRWPGGVAALAGAGGGAILYVLYNGLLAVVLFASLGRSVRARGEAWLAPAAAAFALGALALGILQSLASHPETLRVAMPLLAVARQRGPGLRVAYAAVLGGELLTTAVGNAYGLAARFSPGRGRRAAVVAVTAAALVALWGFVPLVRYGYRFVAAAGAAYLLAMAAGAAAGLGRGGPGRW